MRTAFAFCFLALLALLGGTGVFVYLTRIRSAGVRTLGAKTDVPVVSSFKALYPFEDGTTNSAESAVRGRSMAVLDFVSRRISVIDGNALGQNPLADSFRRVAGTCDKISGNVLIANGGEAVLRMDNGHYTYLFPYRDSANTWGNIREFAAWLKERNIRCVHLLPPFKFDDRVTVFPEGVPHGYAQMVAEYRRFMSDSQIPCLDAADVLLAANPSFYDWFYRIFFHYKAQAGMTIARAAAQKLNNELGVAADFETLNSEKFTRRVYPGLFRAHWAAGRDDDAEDVEVFYPQDDGRFHVEVPNLGLDRTGGFHDTLIAQPWLKSSSRCHNAFLYRFSPLVRVENLTCTNNTRVLLLRRCDASVVCPYLACAVRHLDVIIPSNFDGSIRTLIEKTKPDVVMFCTYMQTDAGDRFWELK